MFVLYGPFCHGALKLYLYTLFATLYDNTINCQHVLQVYEEIEKCEGLADDKNYTNIDGRRKTHSMYSSSGLLF